MPREGDAGLGFITGLAAFPSDLSSRSSLAALQLLCFQRFPFLFQKWG